MRRIKALKLPGGFVMVQASDFRLMRAVVRAADEWWSIGGNRVAAERLLAEAVDAFNARSKRK